MRKALTVLFGIAMLSTSHAFASGPGSDDWTSMPEFAQIVKSARNACAPDGDSSAAAAGQQVARNHHGRPQHPHPFPFPIPIPIPVPVPVPNPGHDHPQPHPRTCGEYRYGRASCFMEFNGMERSLCQVCRENQSCFMAFNGRDRNFCEAYHEGKSCFMAMDNNRDQGWCKVLKEGQSCFMALDGWDRADCEAGRYPRDHQFWIMFFRY